MIDLSQQHLAEVRRLLKKHLPEAQILAFGSRVSATAAEGSDLDLVARSADGSPLSLGLLREAFCDSSLPFTIELLDWATIPEHFRQEILQGYFVVQQGNESLSPKQHGI